MTIHDRDMPRWLPDKKVDTVMARASVLTDPAIDAAGDYDSVNVILRTAPGRQGINTSSRRASYGYDQRIKVPGAAGAVSALNTARTTIELANAAGFRRAPLPML